MNRLFLKKKELRKWLIGSTYWPDSLCLFCCLLLWDLFCWHSIIPVLLVRNKRDRNVHHFNSWFPVICSCLPATTRVPGNSNLSQFLLSGLNCHAHCSLTAMTSIIRIHYFYYNYYYYYLDIALNITTSFVCNVVALLYVILVINIPTIKNQLP